MKKLLLVFSVALSCAAYAQPAGWSAIVPIDITNNLATTVTNYQVRVTVNTQTPIAANQMQASGADIRFGKNCTGTTLYNYWIESGLNSASTQIWVKIDTLLASSTKRIYMYYGNSSASASSAVIGTFVGPHSSTDSVASGGAGGATNSQRGFRFAPTETVLMYAVGKREPNGSTRTVTLFNYATQAIVAQQTVSGAAAQYNYNPLTSPIWLVSGTQYVLELYQGASDGYYFGTSSQIGQHLTYYDMRYCNSCTANTFPTSVLTNYHYGYPDMWYFTKNNLLNANLPTVVVGNGGPLSASSVATSSSLCMGDSTTISASATGGISPYTYLWAPSAGLVNANVSATNAGPSSNTTYTCIVTDGCGTSTVTSVNITVNPLPVVTATASDDSICIGNSTTLSGGGANSYSWDNSVMDGVAFSPTTTTLYTVIGTDLNGCENTASISVEVLPLPVVNALTSSDSICSGDSVIVYGAGDAVTYSWTMSVTDSVAFSPSASGMYHVTGLSAYGCSLMDSVYVNVLALPVVSAMSSDTVVCPGQSVTLNGQGAVVYTWDNNVTDGVSFVPAMPSWYVVTGTDMYGCSDTSSIYIDIDSVHVDLNATAAAVCSGDPVTLTASGGGTYLWNPGGSTTSSITINPTSTITHTVVVTNAGGCSDSASITTTVNQLPNVSLSGPSVVCVTDGVYPISVSPSGGSLGGAGISGNTFNPQVAGAGSADIVYVYTDSNGCVGADTITIVVNDCVGIISYNNGSTFSVSPNPFSNFITLQLDITATANVAMFNSLGQQMMNNRFDAGRHEISTEMLSSGIYFLHVTVGQETRIVKMIRN